ncbi:MAG TPA: alpha/beta hydrolase [Actinocatenispora sp.]
MVAYVIIPGIDGSDRHHWQTLWERQWNRSAVRIRPASWSRPDLDDWVSAVDVAYTAAAGQDDRVALVAHSLGCWAAACWLDRHPSAKVAGALLAAPPDPHGPAFPRQEASTFLAVTAQPLPCPALVIASTDDPYCGPQQAADLAAAWGADQHVVGAHGHLNSASGLGTWPHGRDLLSALLDDGPSLTRHRHAEPRP